MHLAIAECCESSTKLLQTRDLHLTTYAAVSGRGRAGHCTRCACFEVKERSDEGELVAPCYKRRSEEREAGSRTRRKDAPPWELQLIARAPSLLPVSNAGQERSVHPLQSSCQTDGLASPCPAHLCGTAAPAHARLGRLVASSSPRRKHRLACLNVIACGLSTKASRHNLLRRTQRCPSTRHAPLQRVAG